MASDFAYLDQTGASDILAMLLDANGGKMSFPNLVLTDEKLAKSYMLKLSKVSEDQFELELIFVDAEEAQILINDYAAQHLGE